MSPLAPPVLVIMGVAGTGKSTVAGLLAGRLGWAFLEGDDQHPPENVAKMAAGHPLVDDDRWPWLERIAAWIDKRQAAGEPGIVTCSALRRSYRDVMRREGVVFVHLTGDREIVFDRLTRRQGHFMPPALFDSQWQTLEPLEPDEDGLVIDVAQTPEQQAAEVTGRLRLSADA
ncbi:gluconokinase [Microbacterium sp. cx-55]|uniref:gluconokinase n=1 Tax=unclassified Microbacterium TaxID=2609290 RepID=UPI001CC01A41|nr:MULTISPECIES: gluconokinase [unclassified Microbacterium]MBZ4485808.1 gluconokinase [Microbacterium sp. cx-55]MCC4906770.1 gluconokinase [Microbacterium sp. cx-59]UGB34310.1 gluconokinase [Microbacterium sp. cx-55]